MGGIPIVARKARPNEMHLWHPDAYAYLSRVAALCQPREKIEAALRPWARGKGEWAHTVLSLEYGLGLSWFLSPQGLSGFLFGVYLGRLGISGIVWELSRESRINLGFCPGPIWAVWALR